MDFDLSMDLGSLFNRHKLARRFARDGIERRGAGRHPDFSWQEQNGNPYRQEELGFPRRSKILLAIAFLAIGASLGILLLHPFFAITQAHIHASGLERIKKNDLLEAVNSILNGRRAWVFSADTYFLVNVGEVRDILEQKFALASVSVQKTFPHSLTITISEKTSTIIYDNGARYSYVGLDGRIVELLRPVADREWKILPGVSTASSTTTTLPLRVHLPPVDDIEKQFGKYPIVFDTRGIDIAVNTVVLSTSTVAGILRWFGALQDARLGVPFSYISIANDLGDAEFETTAGWRIKGRLMGDIDEQVRAVETVLHDPTRQGPLQYIDVRFPGKIYWQ